MTTANKNMKLWLAANGIFCTPKYIATGSMKRTWRLDDYKLNKAKPDGIGWWGNKDLQKKLTDLGFVDYDGDVLDDYSGNGGDFSVFVKLTDKFMEEAIFSDEAPMMTYLV